MACMSSGASRLLTGLASLGVLASTTYTAAIRDWGAFVPCLACGYAVVVAWLVVRHDSASPVGPALAWTTASIAVVTAHVGRLADLPWSTGIWPANLAGLLALMLVFPGGRSEGRVWRTVPWAFALATLVMVAAQWGGKQVDGKVVGGPDIAWLEPVAIAALITIAACLILGAASLVSRYRSGDRRTRQQIRWLMLAGIVVVVLLVTGWVAEWLGASLERRLHTVPRRHRHPGSDRGGRCDRPARPVRRGPAPQRHDRMAGHGARVGGRLRLGGLRHRPAPLAEHRPDQRRGRVRVGARPAPATAPHRSPRRAGGRS